MKNYTKIYIRHFGFGETDFIPCERCNARSTDIHHIRGRIGSLLTDIKNLIALCRECHNLAHQEKISKQELQEIHNQYLTK